MPVSYSFCAFAVSFGYGGPKRHASGPALVSTNQFPVRSNGAFGRGLDRFSGASALNGSAGGVRSPALRDERRRYPGDDGGNGAGNRNATEHYCGTALPRRPFDQRASIRERHRR